MLKTRILTALILAPLVIAAIYLGSPLVFALVFAAITAAAALEWAALIGLKGPAQQGVYGVAYLAVAATLFLVPALQQPLLLGSLAFWVYALIRVLTFRAHPQPVSRDWADAVFGLLAVGAAFAALLTLKALPDGAHWVLLALTSVWLADVGAYFAGKRFGRRKLLARVSPGKSWEGVIGGQLAVLLVVVTALQLWGQPMPWAWVLLLPLITLASVLGDLFESTLKRRAGVKDSGRLLPGHGGMLDRIDAQLPSLPLWALWVPLSLHLGA